MTAQRSRPSRDLSPAEKPHPIYRWVSRYDYLVPLLRGRPALALTEATAAIENQTGALTLYRRLNKPLLGPIGDSFEELE